jgi:glutamine amidotransferase
MIAIIDYGVGNLASVQKAFEFIGKEAFITNEREKILKASHVVLPGVGAFFEAMKRLKAAKADEVVKEVAKNNVPLLGICLGMQLFLDTSTEGGMETSGLGIVPGKVDVFPDNLGLKIPHMGWNSIDVNKQSRLLEGIPDKSYVYFVHSFYCKAQDEKSIAATSNYGISFDAAIEKGNIFATQFHPEKSGKVGLQILKNFAAI